MTSIRNFPSTYAEVDAFLGDKVARTLCNNTTAAKDVAGTIVVRLHGHRIAVLSLDGGLVVDDCGYRTTTTKQRLNEILRAYGWRIVQRHGWWTVQSLLSSGPHSSYYWNGKDNFGGAERVAA